MITGGVDSAAVSLAAWVCRIQVAEDYPTQIQQASKVTNKVENAC
jgi:hypothetical protein